MKASRIMKEQQMAAILGNGMAAIYCSTKKEHFFHGHSKLAISKSVDKGLSWPRKDKHREKWAKRPTSLVIMLEGQIGALCSKGVKV